MKRYIMILPVLLLFCSCKKFIDIPAPETQVKRSLIFEDDRAALSALTGLYSRMSQVNLEFANAGVTVNTSLSSDEVNYNGPSAEPKAFENNALVPEDNVTLRDRFWNAMYKNIFHANSILEGVVASVTLQDSLKKQLRGECLFVRAMNYFYLLNLFGDVPLLLTTNYVFNQSAARTPVGAVYQQIETDLLEARDLLKTNYPSTNRGRPNKWVVAALLARVYLYQQKWAAAETESESIILSGMYSLVSNLNTVFVPASTETMWQLIRDNANTAGTYLPTSTTTKPTYTVSASLLQSFITGDQRKGSWLGKVTVSGQDHYYPNKYKVKAATPVSEYEVVFRFAEQYLICAEAKANLDKVTGANSAATYVNLIRQRAGLPVVTAVSKTDMLNAIQKERQVEFCTEWGHRWLDLKRTGRADAVLSLIKGVNWQATDVLFPIPSYEMETNPFLIQNPGY